MSVDLRRLGILCVDDSGFLRMLLADCLKALRVGHIHVAEDGRKATDMLLRRADDPALALAHPVDIIISNWQMKGGDGLSFLKWVRQNPASPDRFAPFLLFTAYTDIIHVEQARDHGADDIIAKPFSVKTLRDKIMSLIVRELVFVETKTYFGPDRRRQKLDFSSVDRRLLFEGHAAVQTVHALPAEPVSPALDVRIYRLPNPLQDRVSLPAAVDVLQKADDAQVQKAQQILDNFVDDYPQYAEDQVLELLSLRKKMSALDVSAPDTGQTTQMLGGIRAITHDLIGQGGTFGFPLVTRAAKSLNLLAGKMTQLDGRKLELIQTHIRLLQLILQEKRSGQDHPQVWDAIIGLEVAVQKCLD